MEKHNHLFVDICVNNPKLDKELREIKISDGFKVVRGC